MSTKIMYKREWAGHIPQMRREKKVGMLSASATYYIPTRPLQRPVGGYGNKKTGGIGEN